MCEAVHGPELASEQTLEGVAPHPGHKTTLSKWLFMWRPRKRRGKRNNGWIRGIWLNNLRAFLPLVLKFPNYSYVFLHNYSLPCPLMPSLWLPWQHKARGDIYRGHLNYTAWKSVFHLAIGSVLTPDLEPKVRAPCRQREATGREFWEQGHECGWENLSKK